MLNFGLRSLLLALCAAGALLRRPCAARDSRAGPRPPLRNRYKWRALFLRRVIAVKMGIPVVAADVGVVSFAGL
ncbi:hypothetical protein EVAR_62169_1 [Eumeta japonica]|uniref:Uncharacterized protein n=1 Tax=Eumeta variegata TaxID=151549 RepID=A0A4C1ZWG0_EUMVA|nr:hypothetical protein EVAR_62169_1 [Eumeta japonica]